MESEPHHSNFSFSFLLLTFSDLSGSLDGPFFGDELFEGKWSAGVKFLGRYSNFRPQAKNTAVCEAGGRIGVDGCRIYFMKKPFQD